jgi:hypothetical protein
MRPDVRVLLSSGFSEQDAFERFAEDGPAGFIQKPYVADDLTEKLREVIHARTGRATAASSELPHRRDERSPTA